MRYLILILVLVGCSPARSWQVDNLADTLPELQKVFAYWRSEVGDAPNINLYVTTNDPPISSKTGRRMAGEVKCEFNQVWVTIYLQAVHTREQFRETLLHELAHQALTCSDEDHVDTRDSTMFWEILPDADGRLDPDTLEKLRQ